MSEKKTEIKKKGMKFHKFYTYVYLPITTIVALFMALGRFYSIQAISLNSLKGWVELVHEAYPLVCCVLSLIALPALIGKTSFGRKMVLFSETFKALLSLVLIASYLSYGNVLPAFIYTLLVFAMAFVYGYYRQREWEFDPVVIEPVKTTTAPSPVVEEEKATEEEPVAEEEEPQEEAETVEEEEKEEVEAEEEASPKEITIVETTEGYDDTNTVKITTILSASFTPESPILVDDITIRTQRECSIISIRARNISAKTFSSSTWTMDGIREFKSNAIIAPLSETTINAIINVPTDRTSIRLSSLEERDGSIIDLKNKRQIARPDKFAVSSLSSDDSFHPFLEELKDKENVNAEWLYKEDETSSSWLCPKCGIPVSMEEDKCPLCSLEKEKAKIFSASSLTLLFEEAKENK